MLRDSTVNSRRTAVAAGTAVLVLATAVLFGRVPAVAAPDLDVRVTLGTPEVVMDYSTMSCRRGGGMDLPDVQARAMRRPDGSLLVVSGNAPLNFSLTGPDFDHLTRDCAPILVSGDSPLASSFDNQEWLLAVFRDGETIHGLVHNEYHDPVAANCRPGVTDPGNPCWYNAITYARSTDGGRTFSQVPAPGHVVAALPYPWDPTAPRGAPPPHGYFTPSNIVRGPDGAFYSMFMSISDRATSAQGQCVMRTTDLSDPASWRAWDGTGFNLPMPSPYDAAGNPAPTGRAACTPVSARAIAGMGGSLTYNTYLARYLLVGSGVFSQSGAQVCGTWFSLSTDLIEWSTPRLLMPGKLPYAPCNDGGAPDGSLIYPSLIDHGDTDPNFEHTGAAPHLYYVRWNQGLDRDLLRVPVTFRLAEPGDATETPVPTATPVTPMSRTPTPTGARPTRTAPTATAVPNGHPPHMYLPLAVRGATRADLPTPGAAASPTTAPTRPVRMTPTTTGPLPATATPSPVVSPTPGAPPTAPFEPADGQVYHGTSPNPADVDAYIAALADPAIEPLVEGVHMAIPGTRPANFSANLQRTIQRITGAGRVPHLSFAFSIGDGQPTDRAIAETDQYDAMIDEAARQVAAVRGPVFVRPAFEFNGSWNAYTPGVYPLAFRKFVDRFRAAGAANAVFIWCYEPDGPADFAAVADGAPLWYPGDDHVDWFGLDVFDAGHFDPAVPLSDRRGLTPRGRAEAFLEMARAHDKPVFLSEVAAVKIGITPDPADGDADWSAWFAKWFDWLGAHPEIKGFNIMAQDYTGTKYDRDYGWGNARLQDNPIILARWIEHLRGPAFVHRGQVVVSVPVAAR
jgi:hypothetical protein